MLFHPDKHRDDTSKQIAERQFHQIQTAYEGIVDSSRPAFLSDILLVLSDQSSRNVYDLYGTEGVESMKDWQVGPKLKSPAEIQAEYELHQLRYKQAQAELLTRSISGRIELGLDARRWFDERRRIEYRQHTAFRRVGLAELLVPNTRSLQLSQSTEFEFSETHSGSVSGVMVSRIGRALGYVLLSHQWTLPPTAWTTSGDYLHTNVGVGSRTFLSTKLGRTNLFGSPFLMAELGVQFNQWITEAPPELEASVTSVLGSSLVGRLTYKTGEWSLGSWGIESDPQDSIELELIKQRSKASAHSWKTSMSLGVSDANVTASYEYKLNKFTVVQCGTSVGTEEGVSAFAGISRSILSKNNTIGAQLKWFLAGPMEFKLKLTRFAQSLSVPILLSEEFSFSVLFYMGILPSIGVVLVDEYIYQPMRIRAKQDRLKRLRAQLGEETRQKRVDAVQAQQVMQAAYARNVEEERQKGGIVIMDAFYGYFEELGGDVLSEVDLKALIDRLHSSTQGEEETIDGEAEMEWIDVKVPMQMLVQPQNSTISMPPMRSKRDLIGFCDPCPWRKNNKYLVVRYLFRGRVHQVIVRDSEALVLPQHAHHYSM